VAPASTCGSVYPARVAAVSADGTMVNDRRTGTHVEVKVGLVFTGAERTGRDRRALLNRHLVGATGLWTTFAERFTAACAALGWEVRHRDPGSLLATGCA
jgi:hypothetical protein